MLDEYKEELIDKFFNDQLSKEEKKHFDEYYREDIEFKNDVEAQKTLIHGLELLTIKNDLKQRFRSFHESEKVIDQKVIPIWRKKYFTSIAASVLLLVFFSAYAIIKYEPFSSFKSKEREESSHSTRSNIKAAFNIYDYNYQRVRVLGSIGNKVIGGYGTNFTVPIGSFESINGDVIADTVIIDLADIINSDEIQKIIDDSTLIGNSPIRMFYFNPFYEGSEVSINPLSPPSFDIEHGHFENLEVYYGGKDLNNLEWTLPKSKSPDFIKYPTKLMEDYKRYVMSLDLLDSIKALYSFDGKVYRHKNPNVSKMELSAKLIDETRSFVRNYTQSDKFNYNIETAEKMWDLYFQQRNIISKFDSGVAGKSGNTDTKSHRYLIYEPGWYVVVRRP